jgi:hypothetical protein
MGIGTAVVHVECDKCGEVTDPMELTSLAGGGWDARNIADKLKRQGWTVRGFGDTICPECSEQKSE